MNEDQKPFFNDKKPQMPCKKSNSIISDIKYFFINKPEMNTFIELKSDDDRKRYNKLIYERTGYDVGEYTLLNIHQIGVDTPVDYLFDELMRWNSDTCWWPNHIAKVHVTSNDLSHIDVFLFGKLNFKPGNKIKSPEFHLLRLFNLSILKKIQNPGKNDSVDNAHFLFYKCSGGYPIGVFSLFARKSLPENNEDCESQLFMMVSFNPHGIKSLSKVKLFTKTWEAIHNRVTTNSLTRIKKFCESNYQTSNRINKPGIKMRHPV